MRHARSHDLEALEPLLVRLRLLEVLHEKSRGVFYRGSRAFLHFHEDAGDLFADVRFGDDFERMRVTTPDEQTHLIEMVSATL